MPKSGAVLLAAFATGVLAGVASAAPPRHVAQLGLFPASQGTLRVPDVPADPSFPRLKLPRESGAPIFDTLKADDGRSTLLYSGTRGLPGAGGGELVGGLLHSLSPHWFSTVETSIDTRPSASARSYGVLGQVHRSLPWGFDMSLGLRYRVQDSTGSQTATLDAMPLADRSWSLFPPGLGSAGTAGYELRLNYRYGERNTFGLTYGTGPDFDYTRQLMGFQAGEGRQFGLTGEHWLSPDWALNYGVMAQEQVGAHRGQGLRLGIRYRF